MEEFMDWKNLKQQARTWRDSEKALLELRRCLEREPEETVRTLFSMAEDHKLGYERHLSLEYGVNAESMEPGSLDKRPTALRRAKDLIMCGAMHAFWSLVVQIDRQVRAKRGVAQVVALSTPPVLRGQLLRRRRDDAFAVAAKEVLYLFEELVTVFYEVGRYCRLALREGGGSQRCRELMEWADGRLASFLDAKLSVSQDRRLRTALDELRREYGLSLQEAKAREAYTIAHLAFALREEGMPIRPGSNTTNVISLASRLIQETAPEQALRPERFDAKADLPEVGAGDEDLTVEEDAEYEQQVFEAILDNAGLSKRERQVVEERLKVLEETGDRLTDAEVAARLGVAEGTVKSLGHRVRTKVGPLFDRE